MRLADDGLGACGSRVRQNIHGQCGHATDPLSAERRTLHTGTDLLTDKRIARILTLSTAEAPVAVEAD